MGCMLDGSPGELYTQGLIEQNWLYELVNETKNDPKGKCRA